MPIPQDPGTPESRYRDFKKSRAGSVGILYEGDSWFAYPMWLSTNIINEIKKAYGTKIVQLDRSHSGDEAREMLCGDQFGVLYETMALRNLEFDCIAFSGGGNDIVGKNLPILLREFKAGYTWEDCLNLQRYERRLREIEFAYHDLADLRDDYQPKAWVFTQAYDYGFPSGKGVSILGITAAGGWLKDVMDARKIPAPIQKEIVDHMLARFDDMLIRVASQHDKWTHVRTQGTLSDNEWANELHPTEKGFKKIAEKIRCAFEEVFPQLK
jgi:hypothetical protein